MACPYRKGEDAGDDEPVLPRRGDQPVYYAEYLCLDKILSAQKPKSLEVGGKLAHDENLFIITHQSSELWLKQILLDVGACLEVLAAPRLPEKALGLLEQRLQRVVRILGVLTDSLGVLSTMAPHDFLSFRDFLFPASGFQSAQFRQVEVALGLNSSSRLRYARQDFKSRLNEADAADVTAVEQKPSLFDLINDWLARTPFLKAPGFDFWEEYKAATAKMYELDREHARAEVGDSDADELATRLQAVDEEERAFAASVFDEEKYAELQRAGKKRLSFKAAQAALMINVYRDEPVFQMAYKTLTALVDVDQALTAWRQKHAQMVHRMLGHRSGTGGSSGYHYLKATATAHRVFADLCDVSTYLIPRTMVPRLPESVVKSLRFHYSGQE